MISPIISLYLNHIIIFSLPSGNQAWQWKIRHLQMIFPAITLHFSWDFPASTGGQMSLSVYSLLGYCWLYHVISSIGIIG